MKPIAFHAGGVPAGKGSFRAVPAKHGHRVVVKNDNPRTSAWQALVAWEARRAMRGRPPLKGPVRVEALFALPRCTTHIGARGTVLPSAPIVPAVQRDDVDKLLRAIGDAMSGIVYVDDGQVVEWRTAKCFDEPGYAGGVAVRVTPIPADEQADYLPIYLRGADGGELWR